MRILLGAIVALFVTAAGAWELPPAGQPLTVDALVCKTLESYQKFAAGYDKLSPDDEDSVNDLLADINDPKPMCLAGHMIVIPSYKEEAVFKSKRGLVHIMQVQVVAFEIDGKLVPVKGNVPPMFGGFLEPSSDA